MKLNREETEKQVKDLILEIRILASEGQFTTSWELTKTILRLFDEPFDHIEALEKQLESVHITPLNIKLEAENKELKEKLSEAIEEASKIALLNFENESNKVAEFIAEVSIGYYGEIAFWIPNGLEEKFKDSRESYTVTISKETQ